MMSGTETHVLNGTKRPRGRDMALEKELETFRRNLPEMLPSEGKFGLAPFLVKLSRPCWADTLVGLTTSWAAGWRPHPQSRKHLKSSRLRRAGRMA
jgi:hypothetical protein